MLQTNWMKQRLERVKSGTTNGFAIYYKDLRDLLVLLPPLPLQQKFFAAIVRRFERLRTQQREAERQAEHLFQALLHYAFSGAS
jgi:type I restriction enzyme, S subunit